ncbi:MAG: hypothetical protein IKP38_09840 [Clostridia bacterium]|nr:hypothetical protein [Clostridia bacterium]
MTKRQKFFSAVGQFLKNVFTKNIPLKIIALVFALLLWGYVLSEVKPIYVKKLYGIEVELLNEDELIENGWIVVKDEDYKIPTIDVNLDATIDNHSRISNNNVRYGVDLSGISTSNQDPDEMDVPLKVSAIEIPSYCEEKKISNNEITLHIARVSSKDFRSVKVKTTGDFPVTENLDGTTEGFEYTLTKTVSLKSVFGRKAEIDEISSAEVELDLSKFTDSELAQAPDTFSRTLPVVFRNEADQILNTDATKDVEVTVEGIEIKRYKEVPVKIDLSGEDVIDTDVYNYLCTFADGTLPKTVRIYGSAKDLAKISEISTEMILLDLKSTDNGDELKVIREQDLNANTDSTLLDLNLTRDRVTMKVDLDIPSGITCEQKSTLIRMEIWKLAAAEKEYDIAIEYGDPDEGIEVKDRPETIGIKVSGLSDAMAAFDPAWLSASVDLHHYGQGTHEIPFTIRWNGVDLYVQNYLLTEPESGGDPVIRILLTAQDGKQYQIELVTKTVKVVLEEIRVEEPEG